MPKNKVSDPVTDQEMAFAHLVLSGTVTDRRAAEAVGLNPESAGYVKAKPRVRAYMAEHRLAVREELVRQESEGLRKLNLRRDTILARLWVLANLSPDATRGNLTGQLKALEMITSMIGFSDAPVAPPESNAPEVQADIYSAAWLRKRPAPGAEPVSREPASQPHEQSTDEEPLPGGGSLLVPDPVSPARSSGWQSGPGPLPDLPPDAPPFPASALKRFQNGVGKQAARNPGTRSKSDGT